MFIKLLRYHYDLYSRSNKIVLPMAFWFICMYFMYTSFPVDFVSVNVLSSIVLCYLMLWVTFEYYEMDQPAAEHVVLLKVNNDWVYYMSKMLFLLFLGILLCMIGVFVPIIQNAANGFAMYTNMPAVKDYLFAFFQHFVMAALGISLGGIFQPRIVKWRKAGIFLAALFSISGLLKSEIVFRVPFTIAVAWCLPPIEDIGLALANKTSVKFSELGAEFVLVLAYTLLLFLVQILVLKRKKVY